MPHFSSIEVVRELAKEHWGRTHKNMKEAKSALVNDKQDLAATCLLDLIARFQGFIDAFATKPSHDEPLERPDYAAKIEGVKIGDSLYSADLEDGLDRLVIVGIDKDGYPVACNPNPKKEKMWCFYVGGSHRRTPEEAVRHAADSDVKYHEKRLALAKKALADVEAGRPLDEYFAGVDMGSEE